jgi:hypothetical protein
MAREAGVRLSRERLSDVSMGTVRKRHAQVQRVLEL